VELALLVPFLMFAAVIAVDFARVLYHAQVVTNCARNGAMFGSFSPANAANTAGIKAAALMDAGDLSTTPDVTVKPDVSKAEPPLYDSAGNPIVRVTVTYPFKTITNFPGVPSFMALARTVEMRVAAAQPAPK